MGCHGFLAVTDPLADHVSADQTSNSSIDVYNRAACEVQRAGLPDVAGLAIHGINDFFAGVGIWAHPEPHHVCNRCVAESKPDGHEHQHGRELDALGKSTHDQAAGNAGKRGLESSKHDFRNVDAFAEGCSIGKRARRIVPDAFHEQPVEPADKGIAFREG